MDGSDPTSGLRIREAARALVVTPAREVLLVRFEFPTMTVWAPPGGGLEPGETHVEALERELAEEVGLVGATIGPHVWNRLHIIPFTDGLWDGQRERFHLVSVAERFDPAPHMTWEELNAEHVYEIRWVALDDLASLERDTVVVRPSGLADLLGDLLRDGPPAEPVVVPV